MGELIQLLQKSHTNWSDPLARLSDRRIGQEVGPMEVKAMDLRFLDQG
jgi:hypothetical protein